MFNNIFKNINNLVTRFFNFISFKTTSENNIDNYNDLEKCNLVYSDSSLYNNPTTFTE
jgi:hypothetical protein